MDAHFAVSLQIQNLRCTCPAENEGINSKMAGGDRRRAYARLGGYLDRTSDAPPGTTVIWRGLSRLADLVEGARIAETPSSETYG
ncbi:IS4 family transposase [Paracoccus alcaliphilus]|uniref:IS4 family transposase n=1 Tax=Paracoccus alcaliphilus TaxID=34002 RepID=UPI0023508D41|nr:IS4 family transposase [Paracoccus alcaliphilus]